MLVKISQTRYQSKNIMLKSPKTKIILLTQKKTTLNKNLSKNSQRTAKNTYKKHSNSSSKKEYRQVKDR